ncbi:MAG: glycolate oxidase subunit GlcF [Pirellulaceae bacterium]
MQHNIKDRSQHPWTNSMADAIQKCVHCGFCLPACPTYQVLGEEMDSPRGRIFLMKEVLEDRVGLDSALPYMDKCLGCVGCETACPSGVPYGELLTAFRATAEPQRVRSMSNRVMRKFVLATLPFVGRFRWALRIGLLTKPFRRLVPSAFRPMLQLLPKSIPASRPLPEVNPAVGPRRARVALHIGCAQQVLAPEINWATVRVLTQNGVEVVVPKAQACCGALAAHTGEIEQAKSFAAQNIRAFPADVDAIVTNAAGCGSGIHEYGLWLKGTAEEEAGEAFAKRTQDVSQFLDQLGLVSPPRAKQRVRVAYHDACHLGHAQRIKQPPRKLLKKIAGVELVEIPHGEMCCGSAGTYNIEQPEMAKRLGQEKVASIQSVQPDIVVMGNIGCMMQIRSALNVDSKIKIMHTMEFFDQCYRGEW